VQAADQIELDHIKLIHNDLQLFHRPSWCGRVTRFHSLIFPPPGRPRAADATDSFLRKTGRVLASRRYSIVLADRSTGVVRRFTISLRPAAATVACILALPVLMGLGAHWSAASALEDLELSNAVLEMENASYREATEQLATQIATLQAAVDDLGVRAVVDPAASRAMDKLPATVTSRAMGGGTVEPHTATASGAFGSLNHTFGVLRDVLGAIEGRLNIVRTGVERRQALAAATPSIWPVTGWLSSSYGNRRDPFTGGRDFHPGLDIAANPGVAVQAPADGVIAAASHNGNYGNLVVIEHGFGITTRYGHLARFAVLHGQHVRRGDVIGYVGSTGRSTSPHLHYEILVNGRLTNPLKLLTTR
jgi:murein DD-endopeptidase MepM/ murein hydrolase activator NlpD